MRKRYTAITPQAWISWGIATFFYAYQYVLRVFPSIMMDDMCTTFQINAVQFGTFSGAYYLGYAIVHIPIGLLLDRVGPRWVMTLSIFLCAIGLIPLIYSQSWELAITGRFLIGAGSSTAILAVFKIIRLHFPEKKFATILGFSVMIGLLGAIYGGYPVQKLTMLYPWKTILKIFFGLGLALSLLTAFLIPRQTRNSNDRLVQQSGLAVKKEIMIGFKTPYVFSTALFAALMVGPLEGFADVWGVSFLVKVYGLSKETAAFLPSLIFLGMCFGSPLLAYISEKTGYYKGIVKASALLMSLMFWMLLSQKLSISNINILFILIGILCSYQVIVIHINSMRVPPYYSGLVTAGTNMTIMLFGFVFHHSIGLVLNNGWQGTMAHGIPIYPTSAYITALSIIPIALFMAFLGFIGESIHAHMVRKKERVSY